MIENSNQCQFRLGNKEVVKIFIMILYSVTPSDNDINSNVNYFSWAQNDGTIALPVKLSLLQGLGIAQVRELRPCERFKRKVRS